MYGKYRTVLGERKQKIDAPGENTERIPERDMSDAVPQPAPAGKTLTVRALTRVFD
ncbi:hypothetical protein LMG28688_04640 [Paraburkholderia caffeinitolerans]|uniref:Uncharacterized protein n=1 Tax=Paraburkholderia caffeinitolerans TaxID=1723730 RepID=A0A6J5GFE5_9BURK|nr:hypothetical protein LMG28688_04640 [Paraburkholderia caffeinitolerans]